MDPARPEGLGRGGLCGTVFEVCTEDTGFAGADAGVVELDATAEVGLATAGVMTS